MSIEAMKQALEALRKARRKILTTEECHAATTSLRQAIEQAEKQQIESAAREAIDEFGQERFAKAHAAPVQGHDWQARLKELQIVFKDVDQSGPLLGMGGKKIGCVNHDCDKCQAVEEAEKQQPFGYLWPTERHPEFRFTQQLRDGVEGTPVYTTPQPHREWVGLTDEEIQQVFIANSVMVDNGNTYMVAGLRAVNIGTAIEAKLKELNHVN